MIQNRDWSVLTVTKKSDSGSVSCPSVTGFPLKRKESLSVFRLSSVVRLTNDRGVGSWGEGLGVT